jgi:chorismate mutase
MSDQLLLSNIRNVLSRLEETIIFQLIERAQFLCNPVIYRPGAFGPALEGESLVGFHLREIEKVHARMRRYTSPDEHPFFSGLPEPILPPLAYPENPLRPNKININHRLRTIYEEEIVPTICRPGDDRQYGSSSLCDVISLQALSKRVHYGKFVAESKFRSDPERFSAFCRRGDEAGLRAAITDPAVEGAVLDRVKLKAETYCRELSGEGGDAKIDPGIVVEIYRSFIIPLNKDVQVAYLLETRG